MKNQIIKLTLHSLFAASLMAAPAGLYAADKPAKPSAPVELMPPPPQIVRQPFHGKVEAVDSSKMTLTVDSKIIVITFETKITKNGKPATLADITVGETVGGSARQDETGNLKAAIIRAGEKPKAPKPPQKAVPTPP